MDTTSIIQNLRKKTSIKHKLDYLREISQLSQNCNNDLKIIQSLFLDNLNTLNIAEQEELIIYMTDQDKNLIFKLYEVVSEPLFSGKTVDYKINYILENINKVFIERCFDIMPINISKPADSDEGKIT